ncbi:MAG: 16S rRNA (cytosine(967)-C(5))-methyltransferase [Oscillatoria sp. SIO1A7]|nr:16S rRNA (cytosine(967)-C(5))-methyltransferase [Oscillatoria sp. SIO1A7]
MSNPRQIAFLALRDIYRQDAFAEVILNKYLAREKDCLPADKRLATELIYGCVRRARTLDAIIDCLGTKKSHRQPRDLRIILHIGLYQIAYLDQIPPAAAVNTTVELAKKNGFKGLAGFVNGILRHYLRIGNRESGMGHWAWGIGNRETGGHGDRETGGYGETGGHRRWGDGEMGRWGHGDKETKISNSNLEAKNSNLEAKNSPKPNTQHPTPNTLHPSTSPVVRLGILHSYPDWIVADWLDQLSLAETDRLCQWFNQSPTIDLRVNVLRTSIETVEEKLQNAGIDAVRSPHLPQALRLPKGAGAIENLPGYQQGWWSVQDSSAQMVGYLLDPQPGETVIDACAAPGGKTTHIAELMGDRGTIWACDKEQKRLGKVSKNSDRLQLGSINILAGDSRNFPQFHNSGDRVLLDAPCSGLGTLHRRADARWRQTPDNIKKLSQLQSELLEQVSLWVKNGGILVYATCTLHPSENERVIQGFLDRHPNWGIEPPPPETPPAAFASPEGWLKIWPHHYNMDGFFMVRLRKF